MIRIRLPAQLCALDKFLSQTRSRPPEVDASRVEVRWAKIYARVPSRDARRDRCIRQPIKRDVVENAVAAQPFRFAVENAAIIW